MRGSPYDLRCNVRYKPGENEVGIASSRNAHKKKGPS